MNLSKENIIKYFKRIGQLLGAGIVLGTERPLNPKQDYCDSRDILGYGLGAAIDIGLVGEDADDSNVVAGGLTKKQLQNQINQQIDSDLHKIFSLCDLAAADFDFGLEIQTKLIYQWCHHFIHHI